MTWTRASAVGNRRQTAWAMARPTAKLYEILYWKFVLCFVLSVTLSVLKHICLQLNCLHSSSSLHGMFRPIRPSSGYLTNYPVAAILVSVYIFGASACVVFELSAIGIFVSCFLVGNSYASCTKRNMSFQYNVTYISLNKNVLKYMDFKRELLFCKFHTHFNKTPRSKNNTKIRKNLI
jgi:hypothetical protein